MYQIILKQKHLPELMKWHKVNVLERVFYAITPIVEYNIVLINTRKSTRNTGFYVQ